MHKNALEAVWSIYAEGGLGAFLESRSVVAQVYVRACVVEKDRERREREKERELTCSFACVHTCTRTYTYAYAYIYI